MGQGLAIDPKFNSILVHVVFSPKLLLRNVPKVRSLVATQASLHDTSVGLFAELVSYTWPARSLFPILDINKSVS
jgi:hypothetical protein